MFDTINERLHHIRQGNELSLAIEGRFTNIRIWSGKNANGVYNPNEHDTIFIRLDCAHQYSAPLSDKSYNYLKLPNKTIEQLLIFGFTCDISNLETILSITKDLKYRQLTQW